MQGVPAGAAGTGAGLKINRTQAASVGHSSLAVSEATAASSPAILPGSAPSTSGAGLGLGMGSGSPEVAQMLVSPHAHAGTQAAAPCIGSTVSASSSTPTPGSAPYVTHYTPGYTSLHSCTVRILVVDDVVSNRRMLAKLFIKKWRTVPAHGEGSGTCEAVYGPVACLEAENGVQALEVMSRYGHTFFHVVLMDGSMPEMDGYECTRHMRTQQPALGGRYGGLIIGLTGNALPADIAAFLDSGADDVMIKPADVDMLCRKITVGLAGRELH